MYCRTKLTFLNQGCCYCNIDINLEIVKKLLILTKRKKFHICVHVMAWTRLILFIFIVIEQMLRVSNKGLVSFRHIKLSKDFTCRCRVKVKICLIPYQSPFDDCIIKGYSTEYLTSSTRSLDIKLRYFYSEAMKLTIIGENVDLNRGSSKNVVFKIPDNKRLTFVNSSWHDIKYKAPDNTLISFQYTLKCEKHYYGTTCQKRCVPRDDDFGHNTCNHLGERKCFPGWKGDYCDTSICPKPCQHGVCNETIRQCICNDGWTGSECKVKECQAKPCLNHGICLSNGKCQCRPGYRGKRCEIVPPSTNRTLILSPSIQISSSSISTIFPASTKTNIKFTPIFTPSLHSRSSDISQSTPVLKTKISLKTSVEETYKSYTLSERRQDTTHVFSTEGIDVTELISSTSWVKISTSSVISNSTSTTLFPTPVPDKTNNRTKKVTILAVSSVLSFIFMITCLFFFFLIWKRTKCAQNKRQTTPKINLLEYQESMKSIPSGTSISTAQSMLTPIINKYSDADSGTCVELPELDIVNVNEYPNEFSLKTNSVDFEKYTLQAVDRICWEAIQGNSAHRYERHKEKKRRKRNSVDSITKPIKQNRKLNCNSGYCSSGYNSSGNSPRPKSETSSRSHSSVGFSSENSFTSVLHLLHNINEQVTSFITNDSNNNDDETSTKVTEISTASSSDGDFSHNRKTFEAMNFEGLPNFICYNEDGELQ